MARSLFPATVLVALLLALHTTTVVAVVRKRRPPPPLPALSPSPPTAPSPSPPPRLTGCARRICPPPPLQISPPPPSPSPNLTPTPRAPPPRRSSPPPPLSPTVMSNRNSPPPPPQPPPPSPPPPSPPPPAPPPPSPPPPSPPPPAPPPPSPPTPPPPSPPPPLPPPPSPPPPEPPPPSPPPPSPPPPSPTPSSEPGAAIPPSPSPPPRPPVPPVWSSPPPPPPPPNPPRPSPTAQVLLNFTRGNVSYTVYNSRRTFSQAETFCNARGGNLMSLSSANEQTYVTQILATNNVYSAFGGSVLNVWMGLRINISNNQFWTDGKPLSYLPNVFLGGIDVYADGGCYSLSCNLTSGCIWNMAFPLETGCTTTTRDGFICEIDANMVRAFFPSNRPPPMDTAYVVMRPYSPTPWTQSDVNCKRINGRLLTINDETEYWQIIRTLRNLTDNSTGLFPGSDLDSRGNVRFWIGLQYTTSLANSYWTDGLRADWGFRTETIDVTNINTCYAIVCRPTYCDWQAFWCGEGLPAYICEIRSIAL